MFDMMDVSLWKVKKDSTIIGQVLTFDYNFDRHKIVQGSLGGQTYVQTVGTRRPYGNVKVFCSTVERQRLNTHESTGAYITVQYRNHIYGGYIDDVPEWETVEPGEWYQCTIKLWITQETEIV